MSPSVNPTELISDNDAQIEALRTVVHEAAERGTVLIEPWRLTTNGYLGQSHSRGVGGWMLGTTATLEPAQVVTNDL